MRLQQAFRNAHEVLGPRAPLTTLAQLDDADLDERTRVLEQATNEVTRRVEGDSPQVDQPSIESPPPQQSITAENVHANPALVNEAIHEARPASVPSVTSQPR